MAVLRRPAHRATTAALEAIHPFHISHGLGPRGVYIGQDRYGGPFCFDPWTLYNTGRITNPNILIAGNIGSGKSTLVKTLIARSTTFGIRAAVLDPKGEYGPLAHALGVEPIAVKPGGDARINPLDAGPNSAVLDPREIERRRLELLQSIGSAALNRDLTPTERAAARLALRRVATGRQGSSPTLPQVVAALLDPTDTDAKMVRMDVPQFLDDSRDLALELQRLCEGDLAGMIDGPSTIDVDWDGPLVTIDLAGAAETDALPILMACATAWIHAAVARPDAGRRYIVLDEAWRFLRYLGTARWLRANLKLARQHGLANILVLHRLSDLDTAGDTDTEQAAIAHGLLADTATRILYAQPSGEGRALGTALGIDIVTQGLVATLARGEALWLAGGSVHRVQHQLSPVEVGIAHTDLAMTNGAKRTPPVTLAR
jgi:type IV secretory pathway VirB4 component